MYFSSVNPTPTPRPLVPVGHHVPMGTSLQVRTPTAVGVRADNAGGVSPPPPPPLSLGAVPPLPLPFQIFEGGSGLAVGPKDGNLGRGRA